ncbi:MAG TPA: alanine racemase [Chthoniobacteraceae bacterium]|nr:alanine racemase [Chthoniobacteraceae bacterium]
MKIAELETPALLIDLDRLERNLERWQRFCAERGVRNRPHVKTHKIPEVARMQVESGAVGVTCQKLGEAEAMADGGIGDLFLPYNVVGEAKLERLSGLHRRVERLRVAADSREVGEGLERMAAKAGKPLEVMVECDTGMHRVGIGSPEAAVELAAWIASRAVLKFAGFCTYPANDEATAFMKKAVRLAGERGLSDFGISGGGTPGMWKFSEVWTEYRAGTYAYYDRITVAAGVASPEDCALTVLASVVSTAGEAWVTVDAGTKALSSDQYGQTGFGTLLEEPGGLLVRASEEHGVLQVRGGKPALALGAKVRVVPNHACIVSNLYDVAYAVRGDEVVAQWRITARGKLQ